MVYDTTHVIDSDGNLISETKTPSGSVPVYGYYTKTIVIPQETRASHDVLGMTYRLLLCASYSYLIYALMNSSR